jgi:hypothetical protein
MDDNVLIAHSVPNYNNLHETTMRPKTPCCMHRQASLNGSKGFNFADSYTRVPRSVYPQHCAHSLDKARFLYPFIATLMSPSQIRICLTSTSVDCPFHFISIKKNPRKKERRKKTKRRHHLYIPSVAHAHLRKFKNNLTFWRI